MNPSQITFLHISSISENVNIKDLSEMAVSLKYCCRVLVIGKTDYGFMMIGMNHPFTLQMLNSGTLLIELAGYETIMYEHIFVAEDVLSTEKQLQILLDSQLKTWWQRFKQKYISFR